jgi:hypothetical protein
LEIDHSFVFQFSCLAIASVVLAISIDSTSASYEYDQHGLQDQHGQHDTFSQQFQHDDHGHHGHEDHDKHGHEDHKLKPKIIEYGVPYQIHTVHHHHIQKYQVVKKVEVPVIKKTKYPYYVKVPIKVPYPVVVKPHVVEIPIHKYPIHSSEHKHHETKAKEHHETKHAKHESKHESHSESHHDDHGESDGHESYYGDGGY